MFHFDFAVRKMKSPLSPEYFTFTKRPIAKPPQELVRQAGKVPRGFEHIYSKKGRTHRGRLALAVNKSPKSKLSSPGSSPQGNSSPGTGRVRYLGASPKDAKLTPSNVTTFSKPNFNTVTPTGQKPRQPVARKRTGGNQLIKYNPYQPKTPVTTSTTSTP